MLHEGCTDRGHKEVVINPDSKADEFVCLAQGLNNPVCGVKGASTQKKGHTVGPFPRKGYWRHAENIVVRGLICEGGPPVTGFY